MPSVFDGIISTGQPTPPNIEEVKAAFAARTVNDARKGLDQMLTIVKGQFNAFWGQKELSHKQKGEALGTKGVSIFLAVKAFKDMWDVIKPTDSEGNVVPSSKIGLEAPDTHTITYNADGTVTISEK